MGKKNFYAVKNGRKCGIFKTWLECKSQIDGFSGATYKGFETKEDAEDFLNINATKKENSTKTTIAKKGDAPDCIFYVDGSYEHFLKAFSYGVVAITLADEKHFCKKFEDIELVSMRNVAGEIMGARFAMEYALDHNMKNIEIHYDYEGIEKWAIGAWQATKLGTISYSTYYNNIKDILNVKFVKVAAHSGDKYNDLADKLAKSALGI